MTDVVAEEGAEETLELHAPELGLLRLLMSDHAASRQAPEPGWRTALLLLPRILLNPSLLFGFTVRLAQRGPRVLQYPIRMFQVTVFSCEIYWFKRPGAIEIGPAVSFPHPIGIIIGPGTKIGSGVRIYHNANIGTDREMVVGEAIDRSPRIGDRATIFSYAVIQGPWEIGHDAVVGLRVMVDEHVPPGALKTLRRLRRRGEWAGSTR